MIQVWIQLSEQLQKKTKLDLYISDLDNEFAETQTLPDGFSKTTGFYHLSPVKLIKYNPNKTRGTGRHCSFHFWLKWTQWLLEISVTYGDMWQDHLGGLTLHGTAGLELLSPIEHRTWQGNQIPPQVVLLPRRKGVVSYLVVNARK